LPAVQAELFPQNQGRTEPIEPTPLSMAPGQYGLPALTLLDTYETETFKPDWKKLEQNGAVLEEKLADFGVQGKVEGINPGPVITMYEYAPAPGIKISRIVNLADDLSMALKAMTVRVVAPIPVPAVAMVPLASHAYAPVEVSSEVSISPEQAVNTTTGTHTLPLINLFAIGIATPVRFKTSSRLH